MLLLVVFSAFWAAFRPLRPTEKMMLMVSFPFAYALAIGQNEKNFRESVAEKYQGIAGLRLCRPHAVHHRDQLVCVGRIGGVASLLQLSGGLLGAARRGDCRIARIIADQPGIIGERLLEGAINPEAIDHPRALPIDVLMGDDIGGGAAPASARLDTEQVMAVAASGGGDLVTTPAGLKRRLGQYQLGRHPGLATGGPGRCGKPIQETLYMFTLAAGCGCHGLPDVAPALTHLAKTGSSRSRIRH